MQLLLCLITISSFTSTLHAEARRVYPSNGPHNAQHPFEFYLLPQKHPLNDHLTDLFLNSQMFQSPKHLKKAGFTVTLGNRRTKLMVAGHPLIPQYLIKKFPDDVSQKKQVKNFIRRIDGAEVLRKYIKKHKLKHLVVPEKWIYKLPKDFPVHSYVLVVEKMELVDDWDNPNGEARKLYYDMDIEVLTELCTLLHDVGGYDSLPRNQPFTRAGQIAFIDTEFVGTMKTREQFHRDTLPVLNQDLQAFAIALWDKLEENKKLKIRSLASPSHLISLRKSYGDF
jgi:hypothetical protein